MEKYGKWRPRRSSFGPIVRNQECFGGPMSIRMEVLSLPRLVSVNKYRKILPSGGFYFFLGGITVMRNVTMSKIQPRPNPIRQGSSPLRKKRFARHCFSAGSNAIQSGMMLIRRIMPRIIWWYRSPAIFPWSTIATQVIKNIDNARIAIMTGTLSHSGLIYIKSPVTRLRQIKAAPIIIFSFSERVSMEVYFLFIDYFSRFFFTHQKMSIRIKSGTRKRRSIRMLQSHGQFLRRR